jgi:hypothetical protein
MFLRACNARVVRVSGTRPRSSNTQKSLLLWLSDHIAKHARVINENVCFFPTFVAQMKIRWISWKLAVGDEFSKNDFSFWVLQHRITTENLFSADSYVGKDKFCRFQNKSVFFFLSRRNKSVFFLKSSVSCQSFFWAGALETAGWQLDFSFWRKAFGSPSTPKKNVKPSNLL